MLSDFQVVDFFHTGENNRNFLVNIPDSNVGCANVGPSSGRQYRRWANVGPTFIAVRDVAVVMNYAIRGESWLSTFACAGTSLSHYDMFQWQWRIWLKELVRLGELGNIICGMYIHYMDM